MTSTLRRSTAALLAAMCLCTMALLETNTAFAQCDSVKVTNNTDCALELCLFSDLDVVAMRCWDIPANGSVKIDFPNNFNPNGAVSAGRNRYEFGLNGCTVCYRQRVIIGPTLCCAVVCYDAATCTITINPCTQAICHP